MKSDWNICGDLHVHAHHTMCDHHKPGDPVDYDNAHCGTGAIAEMESYLAKRHFTYAGIVNHATDPMAPEHPTADSEGRIAMHRHAVSQINAKTVGDHLTLLCGVEASLLPDGTLDVTHETLCGIDLVILSRHGGTSGLPIKSLLPAFHTLFTNEPIHILGHPTRYSPKETLDGIDMLMDLCRDHDIAVEVNGEHPLGTRLLAMLVASGALVALGSDVHLNMLADGTAQSVRDIPEIRALMEIGLPEERLVNTWPVEKIQEWLHGRTHAMCSRKTGHTV